MNHWLVKTEPGCFSWDDLEASPGATTMWDGVRNYQARNFMRDGMRPGDPVLFYHSQVNPPAVIGVAEVASDSYPDPTQFDPESRWFDPRSAVDSPRWYLVDIRAVRKLERPVTLHELRHEPELEGIELLRKGSRLSVQPVPAAAFQRVLQLAATEADGVS